jgi:hypothetical protein
MLVTGDDDSQVSNEFTVAALTSRSWKDNLIHVAISGAGHYVHYLQYPYFISLLRQFLLEQRPPMAAARAAVRLLS